MEAYTIPPVLKLQKQAVGQQVTHIDAEVRSWTLHADNAIIAAEATVSPGMLALQCQQQLALLHATTSGSNSHSIWGAPMQPHIHNAAW